MAEGKVAVVVCGGRQFDDVQRLNEVLTAWQRRIGRIVTGGEKGADRLAEQWARRNSIPVSSFQAKWNLHGRSAGYKRNQKLLDQQPAAVIAFPSSADNDDAWGYLATAASEAGVKVIEVSDTGWMQSAGMRTTSRQAGRQVAPQDISSIEIEEPMEPSYPRQAESMERRSAPTTTTTVYDAESDSWKQTQKRLPMTEAEIDQRNYDYYRDNEEDAHVMGTCLNCGEPLSAADDMAGEVTCQLCWHEDESAQHASVHRNARVDYS